MKSQFAECREKIKSLFNDIRRMDPDRGIDVRETLSEGYGAATALETGPNRNDPLDALFTSPCDNPVEVRFEIGIVEVGVSIDQLHAENGKRRPWNPFVLWRIPIKIP
jgi:hypothetical protein